MLLWYSLKKLVLNKVETCVNNEKERKFDSVQRKEANYYHGKRGDWYRKGVTKGADQRCNRREHSNATGQQENHLPLALSS